MSTTNIATQIARLYQDRNDIANSIENKGVDVPDDATYDDFSGLIDQICICGDENCCPDCQGGGDEPTPAPSGSDSVDFIDVDGTVLESYNITDLPLQELPEFPVHDGLTPVENGNNEELWSKTLTEVNLLDHPENIYPRYTVDDDKFTIVFDILEDNTTVELNELYVPSTIRKNTNTTRVDYSVDVEGETYETYAAFNTAVPGDRSIIVNWGDSSQEITHTFTVGQYNSNYNHGYISNFPKLSANSYSSEEDVESEIGDLMNSWNASLWSDNINTNDVIRAAVKINTGGTDGNNAWYKHTYTTAGTYILTIKCNPDTNAPVIGKKNGQNVYLDDTKYCGLFVKGPSTTIYSGLSSATIEEYQTGYKAVTTYESINSVKAIYLPKTFKFNWYNIRLEGSTGYSTSSMESTRYEFYHYAFATAIGGYIVVDDNWECPPLKGWDSDPTPEAGRIPNPVYYLFTRSNIYGINLSNTLTADDNSQNAYAPHPRFMAGIANGFRNSKLKAIYNETSVWANEPHMFEGTNLKSIEPIKNRYYFKGTGVYDDTDETPTAPILGFDEKIGDYAFYNTGYLNNIVLSGDSANYDDGSSNVRNDARYRKGITTIGTYAFAFTNPTTIDRKVYIPTVIRSSEKLVMGPGPGSSSSSGFHYEPAYKQLTINANAFHNNDGLELYINDTAPATKIADDSWTSYVGVEVEVPPVTLVGSLGATNVTIYVPENKVSVYKNASNWSRYADNIQAYNFNE